MNESIINYANYSEIIVDIITVKNIKKPED